MQPAAAPITTLVVEDDPFLRREFATMIEAAPGVELLATAESLATARAAIARHGAPDVLIIDLGLPDGDGTVLIGELAVSAPQTSALVNTVFGDERHVVRALEAGAKGYLLKEASFEEFVSLIRLVHQGGSPLSPQIARHVLKRFAPQRPAVPARSATKFMAEPLTTREVEILNFIAGGNSVPEAAKTLGVSHHTVTTHVKHIYEKLAVNNRVQAVNRAREIGQIK